MNSRRFLGRHRRGRSGRSERASAGPCADALAFGQAANLARVEARYYKKLPDREIECELCPRRCRLGDKERGYCGVRENDGGTYYTLVYGKACCAQRRSDRKEALLPCPAGDDGLLARHGRAATSTASSARTGRSPRPGPSRSSTSTSRPDAAVAAAAAHRCRSIAYTYTEPTVFYEYMFDTAAAPGGAGSGALVVTGGHINPEPLAALTGRRRHQDRPQVVHPDFYKTYVRGEPRARARTRSGPSPRARPGSRSSISSSPRSTTVRPNPRDGRWLAGRGRARRPAPFHPLPSDVSVKNLPPTPVSTLESARRTALGEGLRFVYLGNVPGHEGENTYCPNAGRPSSGGTATASKTRSARGHVRQCRSPSPADGPEAGRRPSSGVLAAGFQIFLLREFAALFNGNELIFGLVLASWLLWGGLGALCARRSAGRSSRPPLGLSAWSVVLFFAASSRSSVLRSAPGPSAGRNDRARTGPPLRAVPGALLNFPLGHAFVLNAGPSAGSSPRPTSWNRPGRRRAGSFRHFLLIRRLSNWQGAAVWAAPRPRPRSRWAEARHGRPRSPRPPRLAVF